MGEQTKEITPEDRQTLFVRGITDQVDEEILYELFQNVSKIFQF